MNRTLNKREQLIADLGHKASEDVMDAVHRTLALCSDHEQRFLVSMFPLASMMGTAWGAWDASGGTAERFRDHIVTMIEGALIQRGDLREKTN